MDYQNDCIFATHSTFKQYWDWLIIMFVVYNTFVIPYDFAFLVKRELYIIDYIYI
jgi:hypothetical protein